MEGMNSGRTPWIITTITLVMAVVLVLWLWNRDQDREALTTKASEERHAAMLLHLAAADSLAQVQDRNDSLGLVQYAAFLETLASLEAHQRAALEHEAAIYRAPADSLPDIVRGLLSDARRRGFIPAR